VIELQLGSLEVESGWLAIPGQPAYHHTACKVQKSDESSDPLGLAISQLFNVLQVGCNILTLQSMVPWQLGARARLIETNRTSAEH